MPNFITDWFVIYVVLGTILALLFLLVLIVIVSMKLNRIEKRLGEISESANEFVKLGLGYFRNRK